MDPVEFTDADRDGLPDHVALTLAKAQPQYRTLPILRFVGDADGRVISKWTFTPEERQAIADGACLFIETLTFNGRFQPMLPSLDLRILCPMDH
jgi:hypothetical protein